MSQAREHAMAGISDAELEAIALQLEQKVQETQRRTNWLADDLRYIRAEQRRRAEGEHKP